MEKAHGWTYLRSKNNGKNREKGAPSNGLPTPQTNNIRTPSSDANTVNTPEDDDFDMQTGYDGSAIYDQQNLDFPEYNQTSDMDMFTSNQLTLDYSPISEMNNSTSSHQSPYVANTMPTDQFSENFDYTNANIDFNLYDDDNDLYSANVHHLPTPSHNIFESTLNPTYNTSSISYPANPMPHISPIGHGNTMLYTPPTSLGDIDEGFEDFPTNNCNITADFPLFPTSNSGTVSSSAPSQLFGELPVVNNFPNLSAQELLDFYEASTRAAVQGNHNNMDWSADDFSGYRSH
jgi:hypothetical protein